MEQEYATIEAPFDGKVLEVMVNVGNRIAPGDPLIWAEFKTQEDEPHVIYGYVPVTMGKRISEGTLVQMELSTANAQEYGMLLGKVKEVSLYAVSSESVAKTIHNPGLVRYLLESEAMVQIKIAPDVDEETPSGYKWTSGVGPPHKVSTGTVCKIKVVVERVKPLYYIFPMWRLAIVDVWGTPAVGTTTAKEQKYAAA